MQIFQADNLDLAPRIFPAGTDVLFHPNSNYLVSGGSVWDIDNQTSLYEFGEVDFQQFSPDGTILFTAQYFNEYIEFTLWQALTGELINTFTVETVHNFTQVVFSEDSSRYAISFRPYDLFSTTGNSFIEVRDITESTLLLSVEATYSEISTLTFANEGQQLVFSNINFGFYGSPLSEVVFWDIANQTILQTIDTNGIEYFILSPDSKWIFVPQIYQSDAYRIELDTQQVLYLPLGNGIDPNAVAVQAQYSSDTSYIGIPYHEQIQYTSEQGVILWGVTAVNDFQVSPIKLFVESSQNAGGIRSIDFSADNSLVAVAYTQLTVIWDIASQSIRQIIDEGGRTQFMEGSSNYLKINNNVWDIETASLINTITPRQNPRNSPNRLLTASLSFDSLIVDNLLTGDEIVTPILDDYLGQVSLIDPKNDLIIFRDEHLFAYDLSSENRLLELDTNPNRFWGSDDGSQLITQTRSETASTGNTLTVYDLETDTSIQLEDNFSQAETIAISLDNQAIFVSQRDTDNNNQLFLYNPQTGSRLAQWQSNMDFITTAIFSPDTRHLLLAGRIRGEGRLEFGLFVWQVSDLLAGNNQAPVSTLNLSQRDFIASAEMSFTANSQDLVISLNDALMGDRTINGYRVDVFDWQDILAIEGSLNGDDMVHLRLETAYNPSFHPTESLVLASSEWNSSFDGSYLTLWDSDTEQLILELDGFSQAELSPDGNLAIALSSNLIGARQMMIWRTADLWNGETDPILTLDASDVTHISFSATGNRIFQQTAYAVITLGIATAD